MILGFCLSFALALTTSASAAEIAVSERGHASNPAWSPNGDFLAFEVNDYAGSVSLYVVKVSNGSPVGQPSKASIPGQSSSFGNGGSVASNTAWHPDNLAIFEGSAAGGSSRLYFLSPGGAAPAQLLTTAQINGDLSWPEISPDGMKIAFVSDTSGDGDIYIWDRASNAVTPAVQSPYSEMAPAYSKSGRLVYSRKNQGGQDLFTWEGSGKPVALVGGNGDQTRPIWVDDTVVFFSNERGEDHWDVVSSTGPGQKRTIARDVRLPVRSSPAISADGRWVAFASSDPELGGYVYFVSTDGTRSAKYQTNLVAAGEPAIIQAGGRTFLAFTALPGEGANWRQLHIEDVTNIVN